MSDRLVLSAAQMRGLASAPRLAIVAALRADGPQSVPDLAKSLGTNSKGLYYHVRALYELNLIRIKGTRESSRRIETVYEAVADGFSTDQSGASEQLIEASREVTRALIRHYGRVWDTAASALPPRSPAREALFVETVNVRLDADATAEFQRRQRELLAWLFSQGLSKSGTRTVVMVFAAPVVENGAD